MTNTQLSDCCKALIIRRFSIAGSLYNSCDGCDSPCDVLVEEVQQEDWEKKFDSKFGKLLNSIDDVYANHKTGKLYEEMKKFISSLLQQARKEAREEALAEAIVAIRNIQKGSIWLQEAEMILAEVIDNLYLGQKKDFCGEGRPHNLGGFKEQVKSEFHHKLEQL